MGRVRPPPPTHPRLISRQVRVPFPQLANPIFSVRIPTMILSDTTIAELIASGQIIILPEFDAKNIRPAGVRLHLGKELLVPKPGQTIDLGGSEDMHYEKVSLNENGYLLKPEEFVLGTTYEKFQVPRDIICHIDGRSTLARLGLSIHCTSQVVDGNFDEPKTVVLEIKNISPTILVLRANIAIAMITFSRLSSPIAQASQRQYRGQDGVTPPNLKVQKE